MIYFLFFSIQTALFTPSDYFNSIYSAEYHIIHYEYNLALEDYNDAFVKCKKPFLKDAHNALICAIKINSDKDIFKYLKLLSEYNLNQAYLNSDFFTITVKKNKYWNKFEHSITSNFQSKSIQNKVLDSLYQSDQQIREDCKKISLNYNIVCHDTLKYIDSINIIQLNSIFIKNGYPADSDLSNIIPGNIPSFFLIIFHDAGNGRYELNELLLDAISKLKLHPQLYSYIMGTFSKDPMYLDFGLGYAVILGGNLYVFQLNDLTRKNKINDTRKAYHLDDLESYCQKIKFQHFNPEFRLIYGGMIMSFAYDNETTKMLEEKWKDSKISEYKILN